MSDPAPPKSSDGDASAADALLEELLRLADDNKQRDLIATIDRAWLEMKRRAPCVSDAESCRQAMLAKYKLSKYDQGRVWKTRAFVRAAAVGWLDGLLALVQTEALQLQGLGNAGVQPGEPGYQVFPEALEIMEELVPYIGERGPVGRIAPSPRFHGRVYYERLAMLDAAIGRHAEACEGYEQARAYCEGDDRGRIKVTGAKTCQRFIAAHGDAVEQEAAIEELLAAIADARSVGQHELVGLGERNLARMREGLTDFASWDTL